MKKSLLLIALPALLALSSCGNVAGKANKDNYNYFKEDTVAHEEFFGGSELAPKRLGEPGDNPVQPGGQFTLTPKVGVQFASYVESAQTLYAIRYVAATSLTSLTGVTASWTRGVSEKDGNQIKSLTGGHNSATLYESLNSNGSSVYATSESEGEFNNYLVYTMYGIPASQVDSYIVAYLTLSKAGQADVVSKAVAAKIDGTNCFSFASNTDGYFLQGTIGGTPRSVVLASDSDITFVDAVYNDVAFESSDSFGSFYFDSSNFKFFGYNTFFDGASDYFDEASLAEYSSPIAAGTHTLYVYGAPVAEANHIHVKNEVTLYLTKNWEWDLRAHVYNYAADTPKTPWPGESMTLVGLNDNNEFMFRYTVDIGLFDRIIFSNNGSGSDQTAAIDISGAINNDAYFLENDSGNKATKWGTFNGVTSHKIIYLTTQYSWDNIYYYAYGPADAKNANWPGKPAKWTGAYNEFSQKIYRLVVDTDTLDTIKFSNNGSSETAGFSLSDLETNSDNAFWVNSDGTHGTWSYSDPALP